MAGAQMVPELHQDAHRKDFQASGPVCGGESKLGANGSPHFLHTVSPLFSIWIVARVKTVPDEYSYPLVTELDLLSEGRD